MSLRRGWVRSLPRPLRNFSAVGAHNLLAGYGLRRHADFSRQLLYSLFIFVLLSIIPLDNFLNFCRSLLHHDPFMAQAFAPFISTPPKKTLRETRTWCSRLVVKYINIMDTLNLLIFSTINPVGVVLS